ncbi:MAG: RsmE family RNA methyltransferase [Treponema sp.]|nr:RsmE family RNA methyltransferase [Treponema sp.]
MNICLFTSEEITLPLKLQDERAQHIIKILHKKEGDTFTAGIIGGKAGNAKITSITDSISFIFEPLSDGKPLNNLRMIIGFPRPIQLKRLLRDIAALGVCEVHLTGTELGEKSYLQSTLVEKGNAYKMLLDGTVQAGSTHVPELFLHKNLRECLNQLEEKEAGKASIKFALDNVNPTASLNTAIKNQIQNNCNDDINVIAAIGSERGWTDNERKLLENHGYIRCGMGERIMRTETAATVAASIILNEMGVLC